MRRLTLLVAFMASVIAAESKTLVVYYSFTGNIHRIVDALTAQVDADVVRVEPAEKGIDYAANGYAIGSALISAIRNNPDDIASYPAIDLVNLDFSAYDCVIVATPLWWSNMAAPMQTFLFEHGDELTGKYIGLIVSSSSSGISGVEGDAKRLVPKGVFLSPSLWIRSSQVEKASLLVSDWLDEIHYGDLSGIDSVGIDDRVKILGVFNMFGQRVYARSNLQSGVYIVRYQRGERITTRKIRL